MRWPWPALGRSGKKEQFYALLCVLISIPPDDDPSVSKHEAINATNEVVLIVFNLLIYHQKIAL